MSASRAELNTMLDTLEETLPRLILLYPDVGDFCSMFIEQADAIESLANPVDMLYVRSRVDRMLASHSTPSPVSIEHTER